ncbi:Nuclear receptor corepressor 2 [Trichuris trichiura]|uniref:Nuclear receptor corepressor 2 n=1 Tax=Trichuris trichiura TaxID=36087 RepID=A0A077ZCH1_TRITR|nr:Nuclear receptor corepressor 2 [Trichuris trichiura]
MWSQDLRSTPANGIGGVPTGGGQYLPWYSQQVPFWYQQLNYEPFEYARQLTGNYDSQSQLLQLPLFNTNESGAPSVQTEPLIAGIPTARTQSDGVTSEEDGGKFQELLRSIRSLSPSSAESDVGPNILFSESIVDIEDDDEEQEPPTSAYAKSAVSPNISISNSSPYSSSPIPRPTFPSPHPVSPSPSPQLCPTRETTEKEESPVACDFVRQLLADEAKEESPKSSFVTKLCASLVNRYIIRFQSFENLVLSASRQLPKCSPISSVFQERVRAWKMTRKQPGQLSPAFVGMKSSKLSSTSADRFKEKQLLREMGSLFSELLVAEEKLANSLKLPHETRGLRVGATFEKAGDADSALARKKKTAAIPPPLSDVTVRPIRYYRVKDPMKKWKVEDRTSRWFCEEEKTEFNKRFKQYSKSFDAIASFIPNKSASDCVKYYNFNKHAEDFKALRNRKKTAYSKHSRPAFPSNIISKMFQTSTVASPTSGVWLKSSSLIMLPRPYEDYITCCKCHTRIASNDLGILTRSSRNFMHPFGDSPRKNFRQNGGQFCANCRKQHVGKQSEKRSCPVFHCTARPRRCREHKSLPDEFFKLDMVLQERLLAEYHLSPLAFKCCFACFNKIKKKINNFLKFYNDEVSDDEPSSSTIGHFTKDEQNMLRDVLFSGCCSSWDEVANRIPNKSAKECRRYANENKSVIFDCTLLTSAVESVHEHAENNGGERNGSETIGAPSENTTTTSAKNAEPVAVQPPYTCLRAVLNAISSVEPVTTSEEAPCQGVEPSSNRTSPKPSWNMKFAFHPSSPCAKLQEEAMANTSAATKRNTDSRRSTDTSFTSPKDVGSSGVATLLENASVGRQSAVMSTSPSEVESSSFNARPISGGCSSISSETGSGVHLNHSNYPNNFATLPIMPLSFGPGHSMNDWYAGGISSTTNGAFGGQPIDLGRPRPTPIAERLYSNLCSPGVNGSTQYSIDSTFCRQQHLEPGTSASALSNVVPAAENRKRLVQGSPTEGINPKMICNGICASVPAVSAAYAGIGQNNLSAPFAGNAYQPLNGFTFNPSSHTFQYPSFAGYQAESANSLINQFNLNGYGANPFYAAGSDYHQAVQNGLLQSAGIPLFNYGFNPYGYGVDNVTNRRIAETLETAIPTAGGTSSSVVGSSSGGSCTRDKKRVEQMFTFLDCSDDENV